VLSTSGLLNNKGQVSDLVERWWVGYLVSSEDVEKGTAKLLLGGQPVGLRV